VCFFFSLDTKSAKEKEEMEMERGEKREPPKKKIISIDTSLRWLSIRAANEQTDVILKYDLLLNQTPSV